MARYHGKRGRVMMSTTGAGAAVTVASLSAWSIDASTDTVETTSFGDPNKTYVQGLPDISGTFDGFFDDTDSTLYTGSNSADGVKLYLYPSIDLLTRYWYGPAWVSYSLTSGVADAVTMSANFSANGAWGRT
jgi:hypothetical protein